MPNLGSSNTPVEGESFGLPAGAELGEDNGDLVIQDSSGTIILRRDEANAEWQFENTDLTGINSIDAGSANLGSVNTDQATIGDATTDGDIPLRIRQDGSDPTFGTVLAENDGWPDYKSHRTTTVFDSVEDHIYRLGVNIDTSTTSAREDTAKPQFIDSWETSFDNGSNRQMERHWEGKFRDGTSFRAVGLKIRYADTDGNETKKIDFSFSDVDTFNVTDRATGDQKLGFNVANATFDLKNGTAARFDNDVEAIYIEDSGGQYQGVLDVDTSDNLRIGNSNYAMYLQGSRVQLGSAGKFDLTGGSLEGLREVGAQPTASDLASQEVAFTKDRDGAGTASWLFKDSTGTAHYWDADGTL